MKDGGRPFPADPPQVPDVKPVPVDPPDPIRPPFKVDARLLAAPPGGRVYVTDMQEFDVKKGPWEFGKHGRLGNPAPGSPVVLNGKLSPHGLGMHPPSEGHARVRYALGGQARVFRASVGFNDEALYGGPGPVTFLVLGDGKELWRSPLMTARKVSQECSVDVGEVDVLELRVHCPGYGYGSHAIWIEPFIEKKPAN